MKDFNSFVKKMEADTSYRDQIQQRLRAEIANIPAAALLGQKSVDKLVYTVADVGIEISFTVLRAYHQWSQLP